MEEIKVKCPPISYTNPDLPVLTVVTDDGQTLSFPLPDEVTHAIYYWKKEVFAVADIREWVNDRKDDLDEYLDGKINVSDIKKDIEEIKNIYLRFMDTDDWNQVVEDAIAHYCM